jgi:hypothetical protein
MRRDEMADSDFLIPERFPYVGLYSTSHGISAVGSPVKVKILEMLARNTSEILQKQVL